MRRVLAASAALAAWMGCAPAPRALWRSIADPELEALFQKPDSAWRGGDAAYSVPLSSGRILWLFGDSFVGQEGVVGRAQVFMIRNSLAIQTPPEPPVFHWRTNGAQPTAPFASSTPGRWLWPLGGLREGSSLHLFFTEMETSTKGLGFACVGNVLVTVPNPDDPPEAWRPETASLPFSRHTPDGDRVFGAAVLRHEGSFYVYGTREDWTRGFSGRGLILARTDSLSDFARWKFHSPKGWGADPDAATEFFLEAATEMSVSWLPDPGEFVAVYTRLGITPEILVRRARRPEGPWSYPAVVYRAPEVGWNGRYYTYAGKAHPELAREPNELVITYAANSQSFQDLFKDLRLYWPRFVRASVH